MADDVYIPGISGKYNSSETIKRIMDAKKEKLTKFEKEKQQIQDEKKSWAEIKDKSLSLQTKAKKLYNFEAPFDDKVSLSTDENSFKATVKRLAEIGEYTIEIKNKATSHRIASNPLPRNFNVPPGEYIINVGKEKVSFSFSGGTVDNFSDTIKKYSKDNIRSTITYDTQNTQILILESNKTGKENIISFGNDKTKELFKKMNFFEDITSYDKPFKIDEKHLTDLSSEKQPLKFVEDGVLLLGTDQVYKFGLSEKIPYKEKLVMEIDMKTQILDPTKRPDEITPNGPNFSKTGDTRIFDINIEGENNLINIPPNVKEEKPKDLNVVDSHYLEIVTNKRTVKLDELNVDATKNTLKFEMNDLISPDETIESVIFKNQNTFKKLEVSNLRFYDEDSKVGVKFTNELAKGEDSLIFLDGLKIQRNTNTVDDLIKGVTINIFEPTIKKEKLKIDRDYEKIVKTIVEFVTDYNAILELVRSKSKIKMDDNGNVESRGDFSAEYGLSSLTSKLRMIMMNQYPTNYGVELTTLSQIGISTDESTGRGMNSEKLKSGGVLEINENKFIEKMEKYPEGVKQLFGFDKNGDFLPDAGIGIDVEALLKSYTERSTGFFDSKQATLDRNIQEKDKEINNYKDKLTMEEKKLKEQFYKMEKASKELQENSKQIDNWSNQK